MNSISKNLKNGTQKYFHSFWGHFIQGDDVIQENQFLDFTFSSITILKANRIHSKAFGKTAQTVTSFTCGDCYIEPSPPTYDFWTAINQLPKLIDLHVSAKIDEIPENAIQPINGTESQLKNFYFWNYRQNVTFKSGAFQHLNKLEYINIAGLIDKFEHGAFKFSNKSDVMLTIRVNSHFTGDVFENGTFDGIQRPLNFIFDLSVLNYLPEGSFKSLLDQNKQNKATFQDEKWATTNIHCEDCRNYWLIRDGKKDQTIRPQCYENRTEHLFDNNVANKLKTKCTKLN